MFIKTSTSALCLLCFGLMITTGTASSFAQSLPNAADIDRVQPNEKKLELLPLPSTSAPEEGSISIAEPPADAKLVKITLNSVTIDGMSVYSQEDFQKFYQADIGREITLDKLWVIAGEITKRYRADGYFLSRAYVPAQEVADGKITIGVVEGYIGQVSIDPKLADNRAVKDIIKSLKKETPITVKTLEKGHLLLSDIPGMENYQGTLTPLKGGAEGAVHLIFAPRKGADERNSYIGFDNFGSRYLGPYELSGSWHGQIIPLQETSISGTVSVPTDELGAVNVSHEIPLRQDLKVELTAGYTQAEPGYTIKPRDIESEALNAGIALNYQVIRQRQENLSFKLAFDGRNSDSTIIGAELTKDRIRALRVSGTYDRTDDWYGYNVVNMTLSQGVSLFGASNADDLNLSRDGAKPNFTKAEIEYSRLQGITADWSGLLTLNAQMSSGSLYSSEEFGFGGQNLGRAYDPSEISGDDGIAAGLEFRYQSLPVWHDTTFQPYGFFDIGKVWNSNSGQEETLTAASTGLGIRLQHINGLSGTFQFAVPLSKPADTPLYGSNGGNTQFSFQIGYSF